MKSAGLVVFFAASTCVTTAGAADATTPIDYTQRNTPFAPGGGVAPEKQNPADKTAPVQDRRYEKSTVDKKTAPLGERRAAIDMSEAREKNVREKDSRRPEKIDHQESTYNHRQSSISTTDDTKKPPTVAKFQDSLTAASATNMARFPAIDKATSAKINRFVFRKNPVEAEAAAANVTPAGGPAAVLK